MAKISRWRHSSSANTEVDLLDYKDDLIEILTNEELEEELKRRKEENVVIDKKIRTHCVDVDIDLYDYIDDSLAISSEEDLIDEIESRGFVVSEKSKMSNYFGTQKELAEFLGLRWWATKEQIINEIKNL